MWVLMRRKQMASDEGQSREMIGLILVGRQVFLYPDEAHSLLNLVQSRAVSNAMILRGEQTPGSYDRA